MALEGPRNREQMWADDAVCEHHEQRAGNAQRLHRRDAEEDQSHVRDRRLCDHPFEIRLTHADYRRVDKTRHSQQYQQRRENNR